MNVHSGILYLGIWITFFSCSIQSPLKCDSDIVIEHKLRNIIFASALGNITKLSDLEENDYCKYHIFTGALINLFHQLPISKSIHEFIHEGIVDVIGTCNTSTPTDIELAFLRACLDKIEDRLTADAVLNEHYLDFKTAIETKMATDSNHTCRRDFIVHSDSQTDKFIRFMLHQRFLDLATKHVNATCDQQTYDYSILALAVIKLAKRPDFRPTVNQMYDESVHEVAQNVTGQFNFLTGPSDCPIISRDPNMDTLVSKLEQRINNDEKVKIEIEFVKKEVTPP